MILPENTRLLKYVSTANTIKIGGIRYPIIKRGNLYWMAQNLRNPIGELNVDYKYRSEDTIEKYGLGYKDRSIMNYPSGTPTEAFASLIPDGWRIPTRSDFYSLGSGLSEYDGAKLLSKEEGGTDNFGFNGMLNGSYSSYGNKWNTTSLQLWTSTPYASYTASQTCIFLIDINGGAIIAYSDGAGGSSYTNFIGVRLCKTAT